MKLVQLTQRDTVLKGEVDYFGQSVTEFTGLRSHTGTLTALKYMSRWSGQHRFCPNLEARRCQQLHPHHFYWVLLGGNRWVLEIHQRLLLTSASVNARQICCQMFSFHVSQGGWAGRRRHMASLHVVSPLPPACTSDSHSSLVYSVINYTVLILDT